MASSHGAIEKLFLLGDKGAAARLYPIVLSKALEYAKQVTPGATLAKKMIFRNGWARIQLAQGRRRIVIYVETSGALYEFFTSEIIDKSVMGTPPNDGTGGNPLSVCGHGSYHRIGKSVKSAPLVELCIDCVDDGEPEPPVGENPQDPWPQEDCGTNVGLQYMKTEDYWLAAKTPLHVWWPNNLGNQFVISQSDVNAYYSRRNMQGWFNGDQALRDYQWISDGAEEPKVYTYDSFTPAAYGMPTLAAGRKPRKACLLSSDTHTVIVMVDNAGTFYAWEPGKYDLPAEIPRVETVTPAYDSRIVDGLGTFNFNSDGTRAVAVALEAPLSPLDESGDTVYKATISDIEGRDYGVGVVGAAYGGAKHNAREDMPHLVEVQLSLGSDQSGDWTFSVAIIKTDRFSDSGNWWMAADYLVGDDRLPYPKDTLAALTFEMVYDNTDPNGIWITPTSPHFPEDIHAKIDTAVSTQAYVSVGGGPAAWTLIERYPMYGNIRTSPGNLTPYTDPFGNPMATWNSAFTYYGNGTQIPAYTATLRALNLRTLSLMFIKNQYNNQTTNSGNRVTSFATRVYAYNELVDAQENADTSQGPVTFEFEWPIANRTAVPDSYLALLGPYAENHFQTEWLAQFNWHPKGHWSINHHLFPTPVFEKDNWQVDIVNTRIGGADIKTTHKALYNKAFGDTRDYQYYDDPTEPDAYRGVFRTAGLWRDK